MRRRALRQRSLTPAVVGSASSAAGTAAQGAPAAPKRHYRANSSPGSEATALFGVRQQQQQQQGHESTEPALSGSSGFSSAQVELQRSPSPPAPIRHHMVIQQQPAHAHWQQDPRQHYRRAPRPSLTRAVLLDQQQHDDIAVPPSRNASSQHQQEQQQQQQRPASAVIRHQQEAADGRWSRSWLCVRQEQAGGLAHVYMHDAPLDDHAWRALPAAQRPELLMTVQQGCSFHGCPHIVGAWHCFHLRYNDAPPVHEEAIMHPNQVQVLASAPPPPARRRGRPPAASTASTTGNASPSGMHHHVTLQPQQQQPHHQDLLVSEQQNPASQQQQQWVVCRVKHDYCSLEDVLEWLSDPTPARISAHLANMLRSLRHRQEQLRHEQLTAGLTTLDDFGGRISNSGDGGGGGGGSAELPAGSASHVRYNGGGDDDDGGGERALLRSASADAGRQGHPGDGAGPGPDEPLWGDTAAAARRASSHSATPEALYNRLCCCYGREALARAGFTRATVTTLVTERAEELLLAASSSSLSASSMGKPRVRAWAAQLHYRRHVEEDYRTHQSLDSLDDPTTWLNRSQQLPDHHQEQQGRPSVAGWRSSGPQRVQSPSPPPQLSKLPPHLQSALQASASPHLAAAAGPLPGTHAPLPVVGGQPATQLLGDRRRGRSMRRSSPAVQVVAAAARAVGAGHASIALSQVPRFG